MYIVDVNKPAGGIDAPPPPPPQPDYPSPPPNAIPFTNAGQQIPIYYNQTVVLQCLTSGVVSPVLIIRKVDHGTTVVGGTVASIPLAQAAFVPAPASGKHTTFTPDRHCRHRRLEAIHKLTKIWQYFVTLSHVNPTRKSTHENKLEHERHPKLMES